MEWRLIEPPLGKDLSYHATAIQLIAWKNAGPVLVWCLARAPLFAGVPHVNQTIILRKTHLPVALLTGGPNIMPLLQAVRSVTHALNTQDMLAYLITDRFAGKTVVTASLRTPSVVTLKMISEIDPATPVVFVRPGTEFPDTKAYQDLIVERFGLENISVTSGRETKVRENDQAHCERMWVEYENRPGMSFEISHVNDTVASYDCWISATYHVRRAEHVQHRVDKEGRIIRVDPLTRWTMSEIYDYMGAHDIPIFQRAYKAEKRVNLDENLELPTTYAF